MQVKYRVHTDMLNVAGRISNKSEPFSRKNQWLLFLWFNILSCNHLMQRTVLEMQTARLMEELFYQSRLIRRRELWQKKPTGIGKLPSALFLTVLRHLSNLLQGELRLYYVFSEDISSKKNSVIFFIQSVKSLHFLFCTDGNHWQTQTWQYVVIILPKCFYFMRSIKRIQILVKHAFSSKFVINIDRSIPLKKEKVFS